MIAGVEVFGATPAGETVHRIALQGGGLRAHILTWGAVLQDLRMAGHGPSLVLGFPDFAPYLTQSPYFGASVGRVANRIRDGHVRIGGKSFQLDRNENDAHHLHGGSGGTGTRVWDIVDIRADRATLSIELADGDMGYPGNIRIGADFALIGAGGLQITYRARTDAPTLCNLAHHSYFNLDGSNRVLDHALHVAADHVLPTDGAMIPTGEVMAVAGTGFDFTSPAPVRQGAGALDHNFCLSDGPAALRPVAWLSSPKSGVTLELQTTAPGLQVYDGAGIASPAPGLTGWPMGAHAGVALEPQIWPDAAHHAHFPQADLLPGQLFEQRNRFVFSKV